MGKFAPSFIHDWFSEWHWKKCARTSYLTDIDRIWTEIRDNRIVAVFELKYPFDEGTYTEDILTQFFETHEIPFYKVYIRPYTYKRTPLFHVFRPSKGLMASFDEEQMKEWIDNNLQESVFLNIAQPLPKEIKMIHEILE